MFIVNVEAAISKDGKWLIIERSKHEEHAPGQLALVGGKVETEGSQVNILERTIIREVEEEVGVIIKSEMTYVQSTSFVTDYGASVVDVVFLCEYESGEAHEKNPDEVESVMWLTTEEILTNPNAPSYLKESIKQAASLL
ncbi:NUDIX domain-containing protein [Alkalihalobacillus sp. LMS39]|uniref:NUDIX hydrolase n=1 Tax=Alkalihalobacillus sp. LMS39 TaxID=2924032 RepID=UPI001FB3D2B1|nr:NUDIX domain-containing protein [Alkalihalobacillus sp. LMS39]UOE95818.1 NUDIX domain-containing protein [Alkalihalobacillus sp. LMS39]